MTPSPAQTEAEHRARREAATDRMRAETGIEEVMIDALVEGFYARVREDALAAFDAELERSLAKRA